VAPYFKGLKKLGEDAANNGLVSTGDPPRG
jgi:hypothetical protein